jgi:NAD(P)-dependent dehydrogenase (short-subunit alcohol dehydrogenase family)/acyl carrier protein
MTDVQTEVRGVFAEVTRYPLEILDLQANLEEDLGIDSVKLGEVFSVLRERFHLPTELDMPRESLVTIAGVSTVLAQFIGANGGNGNGQSASPVAQTPPEDRLLSEVTLVMTGVAAPARNGVDDLLETIREVFAEVTRYPKEILEAHAGLEDDLGIDSVKLGEVFSVLRERYTLPAELDIPRESLGTIAGITGALRQHLSAPPAETPAASVRSTAPPPVTAPASTVNVEDLIVDVFAEVTRYPREILDLGADLEEDLGIDSVKLGEVFSVLRERYRLPSELDIPRDQLRSLRDIAAGLRPYVGAPSPPPVESMAAPAPVNGAGVKVESVPVQARAATPPAPLESQAAALYAYERPASKPFAGKVLFVSGSGRGLGRDVTTYLAELGASVVVNSFHSRAKGEQTAREIRDGGGDAIHLWGSMANPEHVDRVFDEIDAHYGRLDFFIGNASNGMLARLEDITVEHWEKAYRTNVIGLHQSALRAVKLMRRQGGGKIITLSSPASQGYVDYFGCMGTVKAAVESLTRSMAIEFAPYNIQVNCVSPGPVYGELLNKWPESERLIRQWEGNTAYGRLCEARDVSHFIAYLLSEPVKLFTGSVLIMDGGISSQGW